MKSSKNGDNFKKCCTAFQIYVHFLWPLIRLIEELTHRIVSENRLILFGWLVCLILFEISQFPRQLHWSVLSAKGVGGVGGGGGRRY
jgi:hypothetical protein